jgi:hypothetical protein
MTRTIALITATVGAALLFAAPAFADNWGADQRSDSVGYLNPDGADRAAALGQEQVARMLDAREASQTAKLEAQLASKPYPDVFERAVNAAIGDRRGAVLVDDRFDLHPQTAPTTETATNSGWELDLPQVGIGFGLGILLAIGLYLAVRFTRVHRLAH